MYQWIPINGPSDYGQLAALGNNYKAAQLVGTLAHGLTSEVRGILVEEKYTDKDYRSTYYNFYARQGARYERECVRLHFFSEVLKFDSAATGFEVEEAHVQKCYLGFMVVRPIDLDGSTIGRTVLAPSARRSSSGEMIHSDYIAHVLGYKLRVSGFPWMNQHTDISVCAHTACWSILRHNSNRYKKYAEFLTHEVTRMANIQDTGGLFPSAGLTVADAEMVFRNAGTYPWTIARDVNQPSETEDFFRQVHAYLESGFPLYAHMNSEAHAVVLMGQECLPSLPKTSGAAFAWDNVSALLAVDDNWLPYVRVAKTGTADGVTYGVKDIDTVVVPLPDKVFYPANSVQRFAENLPSSLPGLEYPQDDDKVIRYFITTSASLCSFMRAHSDEFDPNLVEGVMSLPMAQFVWIVEFSTRSQWAACQVGVRAVLDATASLYDNFPMWTIFDSKTAWFVDRNVSELATGEQDLLPAKVPYSRMSTNLMQY